MPIGNALKSLLVINLLSAAVFPASAQLIDKTLAPNAADSGIAKILSQQIGTGRGDIHTAESSLYVIRRDPFRSIRRGRQLFQRKFTRAQGQGLLSGDGSGDVGSDQSIAAGLSDSCALCHGLPRGSAGHGGQIAIRPDNRNAPHLFGLGLQEMLADEITGELRAIRDAARAFAIGSGQSQTAQLTSKGIRFGSISAMPDGTLDTSAVQGVDPDLRVRPFFAEGKTISIREFVVGAFNAEMGLEAADPDLLAAAAGSVVITPSGMVLDGTQDAIEAPPAATPSDDPDNDGVANELPEALVDHMEFYLLNYFKPGRGEQTPRAVHGRKTFEKIGCGRCHIADLWIERDRRVADLTTAFDPLVGGFNRLYATAVPLLTAIDDGSGLPTLKQPNRGRFLVKEIFTDFKRHDLGVGFHERNYDGTTRTHFLTEPLWGVASTAPYGHDGRSINLEEVILRHGGQAQPERDKYAGLSGESRSDVVAFLNTLILFPPDDTASNLDPADPSMPGYPQFGHGSVRLTTLFNDPSDIE